MIAASVCARGVYPAPNWLHNAPMKYTLPTNPTEGIKATPVAFVRAMVLAYQKHGKDPGNCLKMAQIAPSELLDDHQRITALQMEVAAAVAMHELDDEALGWFERKLPWGSYGMLCRASLGAPNLGVALKRWCRHHALLTKQLGLHLDVQGEQATLHFNLCADLGAMQELCLVTSMRYVLGYASWVVDSHIPLTAVNFPYSAPPHASAYGLMFSGPAHFSARGACFSFDARYLSLPLRRDEKALQNMLQRALLLTVRQYKRDRLLVQKVRQLLKSQPSETLGTAQIAALLHVSNRTLQRRLQEEGASLIELKDEARRDRAIDLLTRSALGIKQIAQAVGYQNEKSFSRAFKAWTGKSPGEFRRA